MWYMFGTLVSIILAFLLIFLISAWINGRGLGCMAGIIAWDAPGFWEDMPEDDDREYEAAAGITTPYGHGFPRKTERVRGRRAAYIEARRLGIQVENEEKAHNPRMSFYADRSYPNSIGVYWEMTPIEDKEDE